MRWQALLTDLEAQFEAAQAQELAGEVADRSRREAAQLRLTDRLRASVGAMVEVGVAGASVTGRLDAVGPDWVLLTEPPGRSVLVPGAALLTVGGLGQLSAVPGTEGVVASRLRLGHALRGLARDRAVVHVLLADGSGLHGRIERVGADYVDLADLGAGGEHRRTGVAKAVPMAALVLLRDTGY